jgi:hypothetical protein
VLAAHGNLALGLADEFRGGGHGGELSPSPRRIKPRGVMSRE